MEAKNSTLHSLSDFPLSLSSSIFEPARSSAKLASTCIVHFRVLGLQCAESKMGRPGEGGPVIELQALRRECELMHACSLAHASV